MGGGNVFRITINTLILVGSGINVHLEKTDRYTSRKVMGVFLIKFATMTEMTQFYRSPTVGCRACTSGRGVCCSCRGKY